MGSGPPRFDSVAQGYRPLVEGSGSGWRDEHDSLGVVQVPADKYWGAQTQRSLKHFDIGTDRMPMEIYHAYAHIKRAAAAANAECGVLDPSKARVIASVCEEILEGKLDEHFPLSVYQTGSGTQSNSNVNEVVANRANALLASAGEDLHLDSSDDVNRSQSTNDTFVTAMHVAAYLSITEGTIPSLRALADAIGARAREWESVLKVGRTHLMDATLLTVGEEWSGFAAALNAAIEDIERTVDGLLDVAMGGTAVGTGVNAPDGFAERAVAALAASTGIALRRAPNAFAAQSTVDALVRSHASLKSAAVTLFKIANDLRWLASGPRQGLHELIIPANEPGSSMMPGKVNPTQAEALLMVCLTVIGQDTTVAMAGAEGNFQLNAFRPIVISSYLRSARLLTDSTHNFRIFLVEGAQLNRKRIDSNVDREIMTLTALAPHVGHERAAEIVRHALEHDLGAREAAEQLGVDPDVIRLALSPR